MITLQYVTIDAYVKNFSWDLIKNENIMKEISKKNNVFCSKIVNVKKS